MDQKVWRKFRQDWAKIEQHLNLKIVKLIVKIVTIVINCKKCNYCKNCN